MLAPADVEPYARLTGDGGHGGFVQMGQLGKGPGQVGKVLLAAGRRRKGAPARRQQGQGWARHRSPLTPYSHPQRQQHLAPLKFKPVAT